MSKPLRTLLRCGIWLLMACCAVLDGVLGEAAISGYGCLIYWDAAGNLILPQPRPELWVPILGLILVQGLLVVALIRLRERGGNQPALMTPPK